MQDGSDDELPKNKQSNALRNTQCNDPEKQVVDGSAKVNKNGKHRSLSPKA
jgi:hypothetical protein